MTMTGRKIRAMERFARESSALAAKRDERRAKDNEPKVRCYHCRRLVPQADRVRVNGLVYCPADGTEMIFKLREKYGVLYSEAGMSEEAFTYTLGKAS